MSKRKTCDICEKYTGEWKLRKRFSLFTIFNDGYDGESIRELDICDDCLEKFKEFVKKGSTV